MEHKGGRYPWHKTMELEGLLLKDWREYCAPENDRAQPIKSGGDELELFVAFAGEDLAAWTGRRAGGCGRV